jgi:uncharacterized damage-inducible protein DinB
MEINLAESLTAELQQEAGATRRVLERVPESQLQWKPHDKSMSLGELAMHIAVIPRAISDLISEDAEVPTVPRTEATSRAELLTTLDQSVAAAVQKLAEWGDAGLSRTWRMTRDGQTVMEMPRSAMFRSVLLNHWYHHRGQLGVYLRLLDVPLPAVSGTSADEALF